VGIAFYGIVALLIVIVAFIIIRSSIKESKEQEDAGEHLTVEQIVEHYGDRLTSSNFLWGIWHDRHSIKNSELIVKDNEGGCVGIITHYKIPKGNVSRRIELYNHLYECVTNGITSKVSSLIDCEDNEVVMTCDHKTNSEIFYQGESVVEKYTLEHNSIVEDFQSIKVGEEEIGRLISMNDFKCDAVVLDLPIEEIGLPERLFILANMAKGVG